MLPMMKAESVTPKATRRARDHSRAHHRGVAQTGAVLLVFQPVPISLLVRKAKRVRRFQLTVPFLEGPIIE